MARVCSKWESVSIVLGLRTLVSNRDTAVSIDAHCGTGSG